MVEAVVVVVVVVLVDVVVVLDQISQNYPIGIKPELMTFQASLLESKFVISGLVVTPHSPF